jgi:hypothetical protein
MNPQTGIIFWKTAVVVVIAIVTKLLLGARQGEAPKTIRDSHIYAIRSRVKIAGFGAAAIFIVFSIGFRHELVDPSGPWLMGISVGFIYLGLWLATGSVITSDRGITKKTLWLSRTIEWKKISGVRFYERQKYIEVLGEPHKIHIDLRFVALRDLLDEILGHTNVQLEKK